MQVAVHAVAVFALCVPCASLAQGRVVEGVVVDSAGAPVPYANIIASGSQRRIAAGADGRFRFSLDSSAMRAIDVKRIGFHPRTISHDKLLNDASAEVDEFFARVARPLGAKLGSLFLQLPPRFG